MTPTERTGDGASGGANQGQRAPRVGASPPGERPNQTAGAAPAEPSLAEKLRDTRVSLRKDLDVSRHIFRGSPAYVLHDPITFQSQKLDPSDYEIISRITNERSLGEVFDGLVDDGKLEAQDEERFFEFILSLHSLSFLRLPISDHKMLYRRYQLREQAKRREKVRGFLFLRIPVLNPNAFLDRTVRLVQPLFSTPALIAWCVLVGSSLFVAAKHWQELINPVHGLLAAENLPLIWITLIVLKVFHEFGHAYACKHYGGHVPEMGIYLILFTPCAYVDATASWGFTRKRERLIVCLGGMYVEAAIAALAVFVWTMTGPSTINALAYNVMFLAGAVTVLFNINPLMRYDGYYILSDLLEIPNLRRRSAQALSRLGKRVLLSMDAEPQPGGRRLNTILCSFGVCAALYRVSIMIAITAILASKLFFVGVLAGLAMVGLTLTTVVFRLTRYLWYAEETVHRRARAIAISVAVLIGLPTALMWLPLPAGVHATGILRREHEHALRAKTPGFLERVFVEPGLRLDGGTAVATLYNDLTLEHVADVESRLDASHIRRDAYAAEDPAKAAEESAAARALEEAVTEARTKLDELTIRTTAAGSVVESVTDRDIGLYFAQGEPLATLVAGAWQVRTLLAADDLTAIEPDIGDAVTFRPLSRPRYEIPGRIVQITPGGTRQIELEALTHLAGGDVAVDPNTRVAAQPYYELTIELSAPEVDVLRFGATGRIRFGGPCEPIGIAIARRAVRFWNKLREG